MKKYITLLVLFAIARAVSPLTTGVPDGDHLEQEDVPPIAPGDIKVKSLKVIIPQECRPYAPRCPYNTVQVNNQCFRYVGVSMNWIKAKKDCEDQGGYLAIPDFTYNNTAADLSAVYRKLIGTRNIWIGAIDNGSSVEWKWLNGTVLDRDHPNWYHGHPGSYGDKCAMIYRMNVGKLYIITYNCNSWGTFLCQFNPSVYH